MHEIGALCAIFIAISFIIDCIAQILMIIHTVRTARELIAVKGKTRSEHIGRKVNIPLLRGCWLTILLCIFAYSCFVLVIMELSITLFPLVYLLILIFSTQGICILISMLILRALMK